MTKVLNILFIIIFLFIIAFPTLSMFFQAYSTKSYFENRNLAQFPNLTQRRLDILPDDLQHFYDDHFGFRNTMIDTRNQIRARLFVHSDMYMLDGKNGFSFLNPIRVKKQDPSVTYPSLTYKTIFFTPEELKIIKDELEKEYLWFKVRSIPYFLVIGPDKEAVYPEYYPYPTILSNLRLDQLESYLAQNSTIRLLDLREALMNSKREGIHLYYKGDLHWNQYGAFLGYLEIMKKLKETNPSAYIPQPSDFEIKSLKSEVISADILKFASLDDPAEEKLKIVPKENFSGEDKKLKKVFLYGDSFSRSVLGDILTVYNITGLVSFLPFSFEEVHFGDYITDKERKYNERSPLEYDLISKEKPDLVIRETVQRNLRILLGPEYTSF